ncbi:MAG: 1,4-dihydroxy-6-naphthoate synthase [Odoribacter sp.]|nr:1,4-dihydroxy-6-naphthoate synthase [Odoribacter sp.]
MRLTLGFSPCPNDTFIFDAMVHGRIDTEGLEFDYFLADVEELNRRAFAGDVDITKMSYHAYAYAANDYVILDSGSALGRKNGPLLISRQLINKDDLSDKLIAIPGKYTTANLLLGIAWPDALNKKEYLFSDIESALLNGEVDAGLIIHETRFTYHRKGLLKIADLGEYWEKLTGLPIPLGAIVINRSVPDEIAFKVNRILKRSLEYAYKDSIASFDFVVNNAQEMNKNVMNYHIKLFVNDFTLNLGAEGRAAIEKLFSLAGEMKLIPEMPQRIFLTSLAI